MGMRSDFEVSVLFHTDLLPPGKTPLKRGSDGKYILEGTEYMLRGYELGRKRDEAHMKRYDPQRFIGEGHMNEIRRKCEEAGVLPVNEQQIRIVLKLAGGWPA